MLRGFRVASLLFGAIGLSLVAGACGSEGESTFPDPDGSTSSSSSSGPGPGPIGQTDGGDGGDELAKCATEQAKATPLPLDLYVMFDTSGSMSTMVAQSVSKYKAVTDAMNAFVNDTGSAGIGIGLQFFPLPAAGTPASCTSSAECPAATGPCSLRACQRNGPLQFCSVNADCGAGNSIPCIDVGRCANAQNVYCPVGAQCGNDANGFDRGACQAQAAGTCINGDSCQAPDYLTPQVPVALLPGAAPAITAALAGKAPEGNTPTSAALQGAVDAAAAYAAANPGHTVVAVLATDGVPTECDTNMTNIAAIAGTALAANPSIKTFVIGVFAANEAAEAQANLDQIAVAGGTTKAFLVTQGATTTQQFVQAMNQIRGTALPCDYKLPVPDSGVPDFDKLNVQHTAPDGKKTVYPRRDDATKCDASGGWYYDVDPKSGMPSKITLCPSTCAAVKAAGGQVDVVIGCKTQVR